MNPKKIVKKENPIASAPPPIVERSIVTRRVQKGGAVSISQSLRQGTRVNLLQIDEQTFIVSGLPATELHELAGQFPSPASSPYAALSARIRGNLNTIQETRVRRDAPSESDFQPLSDENVLRSANLQRTSRKR